MKRQFGSGGSVGRLLTSLLIHILLVLASLLVLVPFLYLFWIATSSFRDIISPGFNWTPTFANFRSLFRAGEGFPRMLWNSVFVAILSTIIGLAIGALGAYGLSRAKPSRLVPRILLAWLVIVQTIPSIALVGPYYTLGLRTGLYNTRFILILAYLVINLPLVMWMMLTYFQSLPKELEEAAVVDGMNQFQVFLYVMIPLAAPALAASGVLSFIFSWKEFLLALSLTSTPGSMTLPVAIAGFVQDYNIEYGRMAAAASIAVVPGLLLAVFAQRYIVSGLTRGAVKS